MGLDQYAFARKNDENIEIQYWRKHADLEGWMANLYHSRGGKGDFNCVDLKLHREDILSLHATHRNLDTATGFFWGETTDRKIEDTEEFIGKALSYLDDGYDIIYTSWW